MADSSKAERRSLPLNERQRELIEGWIRDTCFHEAGHAVAAIIGGVPFVDVNVRDDPFTEEYPGPGWVHYRGSLTLRDRRTRSEIKATAVNSYAGPLAEQRLKQAEGRWGSGEGDAEMDAEWEEEEWFAGVRHDYESAELSARYANVKHFRPFLKRLNARASLLVEQHWDSIAAVASALYEQPELRSSEKMAMLWDSQVCEIVERVSGPRYGRAYRQAIAREGLYWQPTE